MSDRSRIRRYSVVAFVLFCCAPDVVRGQDPVVAAAGAEGAGQRKVEPIWIEGGSIIVAISTSGRTLYGYSEKTGTWDQVKVENPDNLRLDPIVGNGIACAVVGKRAYGFSGTTGRWDIVELTNSAPAIVDQNRCRIHVESKMYIFSNESGRWAVADLSQDAK